MDGLSRRNPRPLPVESLHDVPRPGAGVLIFALLIIVAPLAFGAVDRVIQIALVFVFAAGLVLHPAAVVRPGKWMNLLLVSAFIALVAKEFAPAPLFGTTSWRMLLETQDGLRFPWTHHPEPSRALEGFLVGVMALLWFAWVRTLAGEATLQPLLAGILFSSAIIVAGCAVAAHLIGPEAMYRLRATANWSGVTTLPSRSYIAPFLAMGALAGAGWIAGAAWNRRGARLIAGLTGMGLVIAAMVMSASRTAALTLVAGATFFVVLVVLRICERRTVAVVALATMIALGLGLVVRFAWFDGGEITSLMRPRMPLWRDALALWKDAPLFGHGINTFSYLLPLYATSGVNHPAVVPPFESGWLQWLAELGAVPWLLVLTVFIAFFSRHVRESFHASSGFFVRAGAAGAVLVAIAHGIIDGSSERWATSAFALAALAIACPFASDGEQTERSAKPAVIAVGTAVFWMLPLMFDLPAWSPLAAARLLARDAAGGKASAHELARAVEAFPLDARLHQALGMHQLSDRHAPVRDWMRHFQIASRLTPGSWIVPYAQARACHDIAPEQARQYWQQAIERGGEQREDLFMRALRETAGDAGAEKFWHDYAGAHPELILLTLAQLPEPARRERFAFWWNQRASGHETFGPNERRLLQLYLPQYGTPEHLEAWMRLRSAWRASEWSDWVRILHGWNEDARAWQIAQSMVADPPFPSTNAALLRDQLLLRWRNDKNDFVNARLLAAALDSEGDAAAASKVILETAERPDAPLWFVQKAAHLLANAGSFRAAVALILRERD